MIRRLLAQGALKAGGWKVRGPVPAPSDTRIFVAAPHTANFDTILMLAVAWQNNLRVKFLIKKEALRGPTGWFLAAAGAIGVDRENPEGLIDELIHLASSGHGFQLVLTPEGTRKPVEYWKSGFYRLAEQTKIPMILVAPDGPSKVVTFGPTFPASGDIRADMDRIRDFFADKRGIDPRKARVPRLRAEEADATEESPDATAAS